MKKYLYILFLLFLFIKVEAAPDATYNIKVGESIYFNNCPYENIKDNNSSFAVIKTENRFTELKCLIVGLNTENNYFTYYDIKVTENDFSNNTDYASIEELINTINNGEYTNKVKEELMSVEGTGPGGSTGSSYVKLYAGYYNGNIYIVFGYEGKEDFIIKLDYDEQTHIVSYKTNTSFASSLDIFINDRTAYFIRKMTMWLMEISPNYEEVQKLINDESITIEYFLDDEMYQEEYVESSPEYNNGMTIDYSLKLSKSINNDIIKNVEESKKEEEQTIEEQPKEDPIIEEKTKSIEQPKEENPYTIDTIIISILILTIVLILLLTNIIYKKRIFKDM